MGARKRPRMIGSKENISDAPWKKGMLGDEELGNGIGVIDVLEFESRIAGGAFCCSGAHRGCSIADTGFLPIDWFGRLDN